MSQQPDTEALKISYKTGIALGRDRTLSKTGRNYQEALRLVSGMAFDNLLSHCGSMGLSESDLDLETLKILFSGRLDLGAERLLVLWADASIETKKKTHQMTEIERENLLNEMVE